MIKYTRISLSEREKIFKLYIEKHSGSYIAKELGRNKGSVASVFRS
jgi:hypothetical protein